MLLGTPVTGGCDGFGGRMFQLRGKWMPIGTGIQCCYKTCLQTQPLTLRDVAKGLAGVSSASPYLHAAIVLG